MRAVLCICVVAAGCDKLFSLDHIDQGATIDGPLADGDGGVPDAPACMYSPRLQLQSTGGSHDPQLSTDRLDLFTVRSPAGNYEIYESVRGDTTTQFGTGTAIASLASSSDDTDPAVTDDGLMILFKSNRSGAYRIHQATRTSRGGAFGTPSIPAGLGNQTVYGLDISPDGLTVYVDDGAKLVMATRSSRTASFGPPTMVTLDRTGFPSVSADGLELFYNGAGVVHRTRDSTTASFDGGSTTQVDMGGSDADIVADGSAIVLTGGSLFDTVYLRERACP